MVAGPDGDGALVEELAEIVGMDVAIVEGHDAHSLFGTRRPVNRHIRNVLEPGHRIRRERFFLLADVFHTQPLEVIYGRTEDDAIADVWRAGLELPGDVVPGRAFGRD